MSGEKVSEISSASVSLGSFTSRKQRSPTLGPFSKKKFSEKIEAKETVKIRVFLNRFMLQIGLLMSYIEFFHTVWHRPNTHNHQGTDMLNEKSKQNKKQTYAIIRTDPSVKKKQF